VYTFEHPEYIYLSALKTFETNLQVHRTSTIYVGNYINVILHLDYTSSAAVILGKITGNKHLLYWLKIKFFRTAMFLATDQFIIIILIQRTNVIIR